MSERHRPDFIEQVHRIDLAAAVRAELEHAAAQQAGVQTMPLWLLALIWMTIGAVLCGGGMFVGWLVWHR
jgi:hypothetical protein